MLEETWRYRSLPLGKGTERRRADFRPPFVPRRSGVHPGAFAILLIEKETWLGVRKMAVCKEKGFDVQRKS